MKGNHLVSGFIVVLMSLFLMTSLLQAAENTSLKKRGQEIARSGVERLTDELKQILLTGKIPVIDVRPPKEYAISHIPGSISIFETDIEQMVKVTPDKLSGPVLYCNGPFCHKTIRVAEKLSRKGYANINKYQPGLPVWRALGNTAETSISGFQYVYGADRTAVYVDARSKEEFKAGTISGAVNIQAGEIEEANKDGRLPYTDHGTRIIVFGNTIPQARQLAEAIAQRAYWNSSYLAGTYEDLKKSGL